MPQRKPPLPDAVLEVLEEWAADQRTQNLRPRSIQERAAAVAGYVRHSKEVDPVAFTTRKLKLWIGREGLSSGTKWTYGQHMRAYHLWLIRAGLRTDNPMDSIELAKKPKTEPRPVEQYQMGHLFAVVNTSRGRERMMVLLAAYAGLRVHEIAKVHGSDFDPVACTLEVLGKGDKRTLISLHDEIVSEAAEYPRDRYWFPHRKYRAGQKDEPITRHHVSALIQAELRRAGVRATPHALRHTFATSLVNADVDMLTIQKLMRHSSPTSTAIYAEVNRVRRAEAVSRLKVPNQL